MINIIDHFWQFELKDFPIHPTLIQLPNAPPRTYFYSNKHRRVLRKKDLTAEAVLGDPSASDFLLVKQISAGEVELSLVLKCEVGELLGNQLANCVFIQLQPSPPSTCIFECSFDPTSKATAKPLLVHTQEQPFWSSQTAHVHIPPAAVQQYMGRLWRELPLALKIKSKCRKIQLIACADHSFEHIRILWCTELTFDAHQFLEIYHSYRFKAIELPAVIQQTKPKPVQTPPLQIRHQFEKLQLEAEKQEEAASCGGQVMCNGCGAKTVEQLCKQASTSDVVLLRRRNKLSLLGVKGEYLLVCESCYYGIDE